MSCSARVKARPSALPAMPCGSSRAAPRPGVRGMTLREGDDEWCPCRSSTGSAPSRMSARPIFAMRRGRPSEKASRRSRRSASRNWRTGSSSSSRYAPTDTASSPPLTNIRRIGRGGQGIVNIDNIERNGPVVASFAATKEDQLMLVTNQAKLIRIGLDSLRVIGRNSAGVRLFDVADGEFVVSTVRIDDTATPENEAEEAIAEEMAARSAQETAALHDARSRRSDTDRAGRRRGRS